MTIDRKPMCNNDVLRLLADHQGRSIALAMAAHFFMLRRRPSAAG